jgi:hypothetical protein
MLSALLFGVLFELAAVWLVVQQTVQRTVTSCDESEGHLFTSWSDISNLYVTSLLCLLLLLQLLLGSDGCGRW